MVFTHFMTWMWTKLSDICCERATNESCGHDYLQFLGWGGPGCIYASFRIKRKDLPNGKKFDKVLVAHEGDWTCEEAMSFYPDFQKYEDVQRTLGHGLSFRKKGVSRINRRSLFLYDFDDIGDGEDYVLSVPATGEEIYFEIYAVDNCSGLTLLRKGEL